MPWLVIFCLFPTVSCSAATPAYATGELLVKLRVGPGLAAAQAIHAQVGATLLRTYPHAGWDHVRLPGGMGVTEAIARYKRTTGVLDAEPNYTRRLYRVTDDPRAAEEWALAAIAAPQAWEMQRGDTNVVVAVIDSGINYAHEDLKLNMWQNPGEIPGNGIDDDGNGYVDDVFGIDAANHDSDPKDDLLHGTACAGIIGAQGNNGVGMVGVNWRVSLMALKSHASNNNAFDSDIIECYEYVMMMKLRGVNVRVTSNSYGGNERGQAIKDAIDAAGNLDILNVFAAGNDGSNNDANPKYPASFLSPSILSVAASDASDNLASFSNYGRTTVHLAAPGLGILTTDFIGPSAYRKNFLGTSAAAPFVAGAAALLAAQEPLASIAELKSALIGSVDVVRSLNNKLISNGRLNVARALLQLSNPGGPPIVTRALPSGNRTPSSAQIQMEFSKPMDRASVEAALSTRPPITGTFIWSNLDRSVAWKPASRLLEATDYRVILQATAHDLEGNPLDGNYNRTADGDESDEFQWAFRLGPLMDDFDRALVVEGGRGQASSSNLNATKEPGEPRHAGVSGGASIWFSWTPPSAGSFTFNTKGSLIDTVMAVYTGTRADSLSPVASNDDDGFEDFSSVTFTAKPGVRYAIAVDGKTFWDYLRDAPPMGRVVLNWSETPAPIVVDFDPPEAKPGERVFINGHFFTGMTNLTLNGVSIAFTNRTDTRIRFTAPDLPLAGPLAVSTPLGTGISTSWFRITRTAIEPLPELDSAPVLTIYPNSATELAIQWSGQASNYVLHSAEKISAQASGWQPLPSKLTPGGNMVLVTNLPGTPRRFFRLVRP